MKQYLHLNPQALEKARDQIVKTMDAVAEQLADGRLYLLGDRFSAADLCFAALSAVLVMPHEYGSPLPAIDALPDQKAREWITQMREHPAGAFALRLYQTKRH